MSSVVSLGSINVDRVAYRSRAEIRCLESSYEWFPQMGETVRTDGVPEEIESQSFRNYLGGKGANQAIAAARAGRPTSLLGAVGADESEYEVVSTLTERGVSTDAIVRADEETGKAYIFVDEEGESWIAILAGANERADPRYVDRTADVIRDADVLLLQNEIPTESMAAALSRLADADDPPTVVFTPAPADGAGRLLETVAAAIDVVVANETEYESLSDRLEAFDGTVVRTRGGEDVLVTGDGIDHRVTPPPVEPVDTTGAGDTFCGYLGARLAAGVSIVDAVELATVAASISTEREGAQTAIPSLETVRRRSSIAQ